MADLIHFIARRARGAVPAARLSTHGGAPSAQVLFFTGVRYERPETTEVTETPAEALDLSDRLDGTPRGSRGKGKRRA